MLRIGENLNVMKKDIGAAMKARDPKPIQELAKAETAAGVDFIDINLGPARKKGAELMEWMVNTVQEVTDTPLCLDTTNIEAMEAGLKACKRDKGKPIINSVSAWKMVGVLKAVQSQLAMMFLLEPMPSY